MVGFFHCNSQYGTSNIAKPIIVNISKDKFPTIGFLESHSDEVEEEEHYLSHELWLLNLVPDLQQLPNQNFPHNCSANKTYIKKKHSALLATSFEAFFLQVQSGINSCNNKTSMSYFSHRFSSLKRALQSTFLHPKRKNQLKISCFLL
jgi:hypothetical protein